MMSHLAATFAALSSVAWAQGHSLVLSCPQFAQRHALPKPAGPLYPGVQFDVGAGPRAVAIGDLNRDGRLDLAIADYISHRVSVLLRLP